MDAVRNSGCRAGSMLLSLTLVACASAPKNVPAPAQVATPTAPVLDASYDWHGLMVLPFGTLLKDAPFTLHEVLMFRDSAHVAQGEDAECYAMERPAPRFLKRTPNEYLLCFKHDRLARVEATVNLPPDEAAQIFSDACGLWQSHSGTAQMGASQVSPVVGAGASGEAAGAQAAANAEQTTATAVGSGACEGRDGATGYASRLEESADPSDRALVIRLDTLAQP